MSGASDRFVEEVRRVAREEARRVSPEIGHYQVVKLKPFTLEAFGSDNQLVDSDPDFDIAPRIRAKAKVGDVAMVVTDHHGDHFLVSLVAPAPQTPAEAETVRKEEVASDRGEMKGSVVEEPEDPFAVGSFFLKPRPEGFPSVEWVTLFEPVNALDNDTWVNPGR